MALKPLILVAVMFAALAPVACGSTKDAARVCAPGQSIACAGANACSGNQVCNADGTGYDPCVCGAGSTDAGGRLTDGGFTEKGPRSGRLGAICSSDAECRANTTCLKSSSKGLGGEGPARGLCTVDCKADSSLCTKVDPTSTCVPDNAGTPNDPKDDTAFCFAVCALGDPAPGTDKCRGRTDLACAVAANSTGVGYCYPACQSDSDCAPRFCNLGTGRCTDTKPSGAPIGAQCTLAAGGCAGACVPHTPAYAECSGTCVIGTVGCGQNLQKGPPYDSYCLLEPSGSTGAGDVGNCAKLCNCDADCGRADAVCEPQTAPTQKATGQKGVCGSTLFIGGGPRPNTPCK